MEISLLKEVGLTEGEAKVYLALLELGASTSGPIVKKSRVSRSIIYNILEKLGFHEVADIAKTHGLSNF